MPGSTRHAGLHRFDPTCCSKHYASLTDRARENRLWHRTDNFRRANSARERSRGGAIAQQGTDRAMDGRCLEPPTFPTALRRTVHERTGGTLPARISRAGVGPESATTAATTGSMELSAD